jgi:hypothetical protein
MPLKMTMNPRSVANNLRTGDERFVDDRSCFEAARLTGLVSRMPEWLRRVSGAELPSPPMRLILVAIVCLAVGFGAGWVVFEKLWQSNAGIDYTSITTIEDRSAQAIKHGVLEVSCQEDHGPFTPVRLTRTATPAAPTT